MSGGGLVAVFGLLGALAAVNVAVRRWAAQRAPAGEGVRLVGQRRLDAHNTLWIVEAEGRRLLIGTGRDGARLLADLERRAP